MPSRQEKKKAKRRAKYLKTRDDVFDSAQAEHKAEPEKKRASQRENYRAEPEKKRTSLRARIEQIQKRNGPLDVQGIEQIPKRNGLLKDSDIAIVLNVHLARRKELRSLKGMSYLYNLPLISRWIT